MIHVKRSNPHSGYRGIQPTFIAGCQEVTNREIAPEKIKTIARDKFIAAFNETPADCCPKCALYTKLIKPARIDDETFYNNLVSNGADTLEGIIYTHTKDLLTNFLDQTADAAYRIYNFHKEINGLSREEMLERYPATLVNKYDGTVKAVISKTGRNIQEAARKTMAKGIADFTTEKLDHARQHYIDATLKLAHRLRVKGVQLSSNIEVFSERIDNAGNIAITIRSEKVFVRAWTIIASGPIVSPHYRYLIK